MRAVRERGPMLIDFGWRGLLAMTCDMACDALRRDAGRAVVALGEIVVRAGHRIGGRR